MLFDPSRFTMIIEGYLNPHLIKVDDYKEISIPTIT